MSGVAFLTVFLVNIDCMLAPPSLFFLDRCFAEVLAPRPPTLTVLTEKNEAPGRGRNPPGVA